MIIASPFSGPGLGLVPNWLFSADPVENPHLNPFISPPIPRSCAECAPPGVMPSRDGLGFPMVVEENAQHCAGCKPEVLSGALGIVMKDWSVLSPTTGGFGWVMADEGKLNPGYPGHPGGPGYPSTFGVRNAPLEGAVGAAGWLWDHRSEIGLGVGILAVAGVAAWLLA